MFVLETRLNGDESLYEKEDSEWFPLAYKEAGRSWSIQIIDRKIVSLNPSFSKIVEESIEGKISEYMDGVTFAVVTEEEAAMILFGAK